MGILSVVLLGVSFVYSSLGFAGVEWLIGGDGREEVRSESCSHLLSVNPNYHGGIMITRSETVRFYATTNRTPHELVTDQIFPRKMVAFKKLKGLKILDAGCGKEARLVQGLWEMGIDAYGIDAALNPSLESLFLRRGDMKDTHFPSEIFDGIYSYQSFFTYETFPPPMDFDSKAAVEILKEFKRILKPGGFIRLAPVDSALIKRLVQDVPGLFIKVFGEDYVEIRRK